MGKKISLSVNELLFQTYDSNKPFFSKDPKNQRYCLVIEHIEGSLDRARLYNGFINGVFPRTGEPNPPVWDISESGIKLTKRAANHFQEKGIFVLINAPRGIDIKRVADKVYIIEMDKIELRSEYPKPTYTPSQQDLLGIPPSSR